ALTVPSRWNAIYLGLAWSGLMWTRPDSFIYFGFIGIGFFLFNAGRGISRSRLGLLKMFVVAGLITTLLYLPWFLWSWHYFGSPVPHTIIAKAAVRVAAPLQAGSLFVNFLTFPLSILLGLVSDQAATSVNITFAPTYTNLGGWHWASLFYPKLVACVCAL